MCFVKNGSTGCFIYTTGLHADNTVLYDINDTDTMLAA